MFPTSIHKRKKQSLLEEKIPVFTLENNKIIFKDGRVAIGFRVSGAPLESWQEGDFLHAHQVLSQQLKMLPVGTVVQKTDIYFDREHKLNSNTSGFYAGKLYDHFFARLVLFHEGYLFLSFPSKSKHRLKQVNPLTSLFSVASSPFENPFARIGELLEEAETIAKEFVSGLYSLKDVTFSRLNETALNKLLMRFLNLSFDYIPEKLRREMYNDPSGLVVGEKKANIISMRGQGSEVFASVKNHYGVESPFSYPLTQYLQFPHVFTQCLLVEDTTSGLKTLDFEKKLNNSLDWLTTQDHELKAEEIDEFTAYVRSNNSLIVNLHLSVMVFESDEHLRKSYVERSINALRQMYGAESIVESYDTGNLFFASIPGNGFQNYRWLLTTGDIGSCYFHFMSGYQGDQLGDYLCDRFRNLLQVNLFNTQLSNQNCVVIGPSGSGKSYTMGSFIAQRLERGARQIIIDKGGTYRNVMYALNGKHFDQTYFEYTPDRPLAFNPFLLEKSQDGQYRLLSEKSNFLIALLSTLWKGGTGEDLTPAERSIFKMILPRYYMHLNEDRSTYPGITSFCEFLKQYHDSHQYDSAYLSEIKYFDIEEFLTVVKPFIAGEYAHVLNARKEIDISDHPLVCFDLDKIKSDTTLYPIITLLITELALDQIRKYPDTIKYLYLDEAWSMLSGKLQEFINELFRTIRKNNGSVSIITQGLDEIIRSSIGEAILVNADTKIILKHQDKRLIEDLARHLGFTTHEVDLIHSMRAEKTFRELFIKQGEEARVYVLETSPHLDAVLSSKPGERNYLRRLVEYYHGNLAYAVNQYVAERREPETHGIKGKLIGNKQNSKVSVS